MANMTFSNPNGQQVTIDSPDGSTPSEQELDQMFAAKYNAGNQAPGDSQQSQNQGQPDAMDSALQGGIEAGSNFDNKQNQPTQPQQQSTPINSPDFLPQAGVALTQGLLQSGESLLNIAQGVTNLATAPFTPLGVKAPQIFEQASKYLGNLEENLPEDNINPVVKFGLNMAGGAPIGLGEYGAASKLVEGAGDLLKGSRGLQGAQKVMGSAGEGMDEAQRAQMATSLIGANEGLQTIPVSQKIVEGFLTDPILKEGTKMAMISALNDYGQTDEAKDLFSGAGKGFVYGAGVGAAGKLFDHAVDLMKDNGAPAMKKWIAAVTGNPEIKVGGKMVKLADDVVENPSKYSVNVNPNNETSEEFLARNKEEQSVMDKDHSEQMNKMRNDFAEQHADRLSEIKTLSQQAKDARDRLSSYHNRGIENEQSVKDTGMFKATQQNQMANEEFKNTNDREAQSTIEELQKNVQDTQVKLQEAVSAMMAEQKATFEMQRSNTQKSINRASQRLSKRNPGIGVNLSDVEGKVKGAVNQKTSLGGQVIIPSKTENPQEIGESGDKAALIKMLNQTKGKTGLRAKIPANISKEQPFQVESGVPGENTNSAISTINSIMKDFRDIASDNGGKVPLHQLDLVRTKIQQLYEAADVKGNRPLKQVLDDLYQAFNPTSYADKFAGNKDMSILSALKEKYHNTADLYKKMDDLFFDAKGNPTPDKVLKAFDQNSWIANKYKEAEAGLPEKLKLSTRIQDIINQTKDYVKNQGETIKATKSDLDKRIADSRRTNAEKLFNLNKQYNDGLKGLRDERDRAVEEQRFKDVKSINQKRVDLDKWRVTQTQAIKEAHETFLSHAQEASDKAKEQYDFLKSQELLAGSKIPDKAKLAYPQKYLQWHALFDMFSSPIKAAAYLGGSGLLSPNLALRAFKATRNMKVPAGVAVPAGILKKMLQHPIARQQLATHLATQSRKQR